MANPFDTDEMASGYARCRPPIHRPIVEAAWRRLGRQQPFSRALDIGCGAGVSARALAGFAHHCIGLEPAEPMLRWSSEVAPGADFVVGMAEALPVRDSSLDLIAAAGSLNYVDFALFFPAARRALRYGGFLLVYDFSAGITFSDCNALQAWHEEFLRRYPSPLEEAKTLSPEILANLDSGFIIHSAEPVTATVTLTPEFYLSYIMTESNVAFALRQGTPRVEVREWCADTLRPVWEGRAREVVFPGYFAWMTPVASNSP